MMKKIEKNEKENGQIMENVFQKNYRRIMKQWLENFENVILKMKKFLKNNENVGDKKLRKK